MAGSNDFTGQNIQDTYQRVLQLSSSGELADGTGSLVPLLTVTASHAISASHEITFELSSSHAKQQIKQDLSQQQLQVKHMIQLLVLVRDNYYLQNLTMELIL